jgi:hypothetical protein
MTSASNGLAERGAEDMTKSNNTQMIDHRSAEAEPAQVRAAHEAIEKLYNDAPRYIAEVLAAAGPVSLDWILDLFMAAQAEALEQMFEDLVKDNHYRIETSTDEYGGKYYQLAEGVGPDALSIRVYSQ